jgi:hypothetical protein
MKYKYDPRMLRTTWFALLILLLTGTISWKYYRNYKIGKVAVFIYPNRKNKLANAINELCLSDDFGMLLTGEDKYKIITGHILEYKKDVKKYYLNELKKS